MPQPGQHSTEKRILFYPSSTPGSKKLVLAHFLITADTLIAQGLSSSLRPSGITPRRDDPEEMAPRTRVPLYACFYERYLWRSDFWLIRCPWMPLKHRSRSSLTTRFQQVKSDVDQSTWLLCAPALHAILHPDLLKRVDAMMKSSICCFLGVLCFVGHILVWS